MNKKWKTIEVSTPERIFDKIKTEMAQPVGIILFGADCEFKNKVIERLAKGLVNSALFCLKESDLPADYLKMRIPQGCMHAYVFVLGTSASSNHKVRHEWVQTIRNMGAKTVVGVYVKASKVSIRPLISSLERIRYNKQVTDIEQSNPTADGLDYFIEIPEKEE